MTMLTRGWAARRSGGRQSRSAGAASGMRSPISGEAGERWSQELGPVVSRDDNAHARVGRSAQRWAPVAQRWSGQRDALPELDGFADHKLLTLRRARRLRTVNAVHESEPGRRKG